MRFNSDLMKRKMVLTQKSHRYNLKILGEICLALCKIEYHLGLDLNSLLNLLSLELLLTFYEARQTI